MAGLKPFDESSPAYRGMLGALWPRGPIWDPTQPGVAGLTAGFALEATRFHNRLVALMREAFPATADELLAEWEDAYGLPLCTAPETDDGRRLALAGRVAAQGGQARGYYIALAWAVLEADGEYSRVDDPEGVWIEERPFGSPFVAWGSAAWEAGSPSAAVFHWILHLPAGVSEVKTDIIECLLCRFKPAHTVLVRDDASYVCETPGEPEVASSITAFYSSPGDSGDYAEVTGFDAMFTGSGVAAVALSFWVRAAVGADADGVLTMCEVGDDGSPALRATYSGNELAAQITDDTGTLIAEHILDGNTDGAWHHIMVVPRADPTLVGEAVVPTAGGVSIYVDGETTDGNADSGTYATATSLLRLFARHDGSDRFPGDIANVAVFASIPDITQLPALHAAGVQHDVRHPHGQWAGYQPIAYYRTADYGGVVPNSGTDTGIGGLMFFGNITSKAF